jgi:polysaccharide biosynthesis/export protein
MVEVHAMWCEAASSSQRRYVWQTAVLAATLMFSIVSWGQRSAAGVNASGADIGGAAGPGPKSNELQIPGSADPAKLKLGPGDLVEISVYGVQELSTKARVSNAGDLYLPLVDYVHVANLSLEEAQGVIEKRLSDGGFVKDAHVTLFIDEYASQAVTLLGEVGRPGVYPIFGERRLFDVVSAAGGFTEKAGKIVSITHREKPERVSTVRLPQRLEQSSAGNVMLFPGDTVVISRAGVVYVVGDVQRPSGFLMESDSMTVLEAVAMAGGPTKTAKLNGARLIRKTPQGRQESSVPLKNILRAKTADIPMQADDILFVPSSTGRSVMYRSAEAVVQTASALTIVGAHP